MRTGCNGSLNLKSNLFIPDLIFVIVYQLCVCMSQETRFFRRFLAYLFRRTVILFIFQRLIRSIPTPATPPHTRAVATHSIPDPVKHLMKPLRYGLDTHKNLFASRLTLVQCRVHAQASVVPPTYLAIAAFNLRIVPLHSSPVLVFFLNQHVRLPEVSVNNALTKIICNTASSTSRIFAARALDFAVKFRFVFSYENVVFRRYV